jgi:hypothetical protein
MNCTLQLVERTAHGIAIELEPLPLHYWRNLQLPVFRTGSFGIGGPELRNSGSKAIASH